MALPENTVLTGTSRELRERGESNWIERAATDPEFVRDRLEILEAVLAQAVSDSIAEQETLRRLVNGRLGRLRTKVER